jgi:hypothetical protein
VILPIFSLLVTPRRVARPSRGPPVNATYRRTATLWEGRYRAAPIDSDAYFLACCRYIERKRCELPRRRAAYDRVLNRVGIQYWRISSTTAGISL